MKSIIIILIGIFSGIMIDTGYGSHHPGNNYPPSYHHYYELPRRVVARLSDRYHQFDLIHSQKVYHRGRTTFHLLLQNRHRFVEVSINDRGRIFNEVRYRGNPHGYYVHNRPHRRYRNHPYRYGYGTYGKRNNRYHHGNQREWDRSHRHHHHSDRKRNHQYQQDDRFDDRAYPRHHRNGRKGG